MFNFHFLVYFYFSRSNMLLWKYIFSYIITRSNNLSNLAIRVARLIEMKICTHTSQLLGIRMLNGKS